MEKLVLSMKGCAIESRYSLCAAPLLIHIVCTVFSTHSVVKESTSNYSFVRGGSGGELGRTLGVWFIWSLRSSSPTSPG